MARFLRWRQGRRITQSLRWSLGRRRGRTTESLNVDSDELLTRILEGVRRDNELLVQRLMREVEELRRRDNYVPVEDYA
ncbi:hypothetical protein CASFOL_009468 [Castilleja foliolosa]|uniref:Uncharacterized protein n=1 Tax=Castilleja foliolosa TaxID=1961234 RepID=A0ABD3E1D2_9LAMI